MRNDVVICEYGHTGCSSEERGDCQAMARFERWREGIVTLPQGQTGRVTGYCINREHLNSNEVDGTPRAGGPRYAVRMENGNTVWMAPTHLRRRP